MMDLKLQTCCFTGHRKIPPEQYEEIARRLKAEVDRSIQLGYRFFGTGGALGFDTLAAKTVIMLREKYPHIRLILVLPCRSQSYNWSIEDKKMYDEIKGKADKIVYISEDYYNGCMQKRNRHLVDCSSLCICYLTNGRSGTGYTVNYAEKKSISIINIAKK